MRPVTHEYCQVLLAQQKADEQHAFHTVLFVGLLITRASGFKARASKGHPALDTRAASGQVRFNRLAKTPREGICARDCNARRHSGLASKKDSSPRPVCVSLFAVQVDEGRRSLSIAAESMHSASAAALVHACSMERRPRSKGCDAHVAAAAPAFSVPVAGPPPMQSSVTARLQESAAAQPSWLALRTGLPLNTCPVCSLPRCSPCKHK